MIFFGTIIMLPNISFDFEDNSFEDDFDDDIDESD